MPSLIFVDVEAGFDSPCPNVGATGMTEFGAVERVSKKTFHGLPDKSQNNVWYETFVEFDKWLWQFPPNHMFVSDNPAYDWQWINYHFHKNLGKNPFGFSARRIGDFYAGLINDFFKYNQWKKLRVTTHDHNPVNDAMGNVEAFDRMIKGGRI
jgi:hypothetical protein